MKKSDWNVLMETAYEIAKTENPKEEGDYTGEDGLLYCGKCRTPKEYLTNWYGGTKKIVPVPCKCIKERNELKRKRELREQILDASNFDKKYHERTLDSIEVTEDNKRQIAICKRYVEKFDELYQKNQGLMLYGNFGTGKTLIACCVGNELMNGLRRVMLLSLAKELQGGPKNNYDEIMGKVSAVDLLIVDDLGAERGTDFAQEFVLSVIDTRCNTNKPMIVTTNLTLQEMQECADIRLRRTYDRVLEVCYPVQFNGKSWRMKNAASRFDDFTKILGGN